MFCQTALHRLHGLPSTWISRVDDHCPGFQTEEAEKLLAQSDPYALALLTSALEHCVKLEADVTGPAVADLHAIAKEQHAKVSQHLLEFS